MLVPSQPATMDQVPLPNSPPSSQGQAWRLLIPQEWASGPCQPMELLKEANNVLPWGTGAPHPLVTTKPLQQCLLVHSARGHPVWPCVVCGVPSPRWCVCVAMTCCLSHLSSIRSWVLGRSQNLQQDLSSAE